MKQEEVIARIRAFLGDFAQEHRAGVLSTVDASGRPHATWMGTVAPPSLDRILTMTSPDSRKIINILQNPTVEWMLTDEPMARVLYLRGKAHVIEDPLQVAAAWEQLGDKRQAWFMRFQEKVGISFFVIETLVEEVEYREPHENFVKILSGVKGNGGDKGNKKAPVAAPRQ